MRALRDQETPGEDELGWLALGCRVAHNVWDDESWCALSARLAEQSRQAGALTVLLVALLLGQTIQLVTGGFAAAAGMAGEAEAVAQATGNPAGPYGPLLLAAWAGEQAKVGELIAAATPQMVARGEGQWLTAAAWATAVASNGLGRYDEALAAAEQASEHPGELGLATWSLAELIEAADADCGRAERRERSALRRLSSRSPAAAAPTGRSASRRGRGRCSATASAAEGPVPRGDRAPRPHPRPASSWPARHLLYGEWLRRENDAASDAREQLRTRPATCSPRWGSRRSPARARRELLATGENAAQARRRDAPTSSLPRRPRSPGSPGPAHTNPEISTQLFISPRTVEWHLRKVFIKLGVTSRRELRGALPGLERATVPA